MPSSICVNLLVYLLFTASSGIVGFDPGSLHGLNILSWGDRTHDEITKCALYQVTAKYLENIYREEVNIGRINYGRCGDAKASIKKAVKKYGFDWSIYDNALDLIAKSNRHVDKYDWSVEEAHFDSETFAQGAARILQLKVAAIESLEDNYSNNARSFIGNLFHTVQDFYSHSNWVDFEPSQINENLFRRENLGPVADFTQRTCLSCASTSCVSQVAPELTQKRILTSGYFRVKYLGGKMKPRGKCSHGGDVDSTKIEDAVGGGINKDTQSSIQGEKHLTAVALAQQSSFQILLDLWGIVGPNKFGQFLGLQQKRSAITFVVDVSSSGNDAVLSVKQTVDSLIADQKSRFEFVLSPYGSLGWGPLLKTANVSELKTINNNVVPDQSSPFYHALLEAVEAAKSRSVVFAFVTDFKKSFSQAVSKNAEFHSRILLLAREKHIKIHPVLLRPSSALTTLYSSHEYEEMAMLTGGLNIVSPFDSALNMRDFILKG